VPRPKERTAELRDEVLAAAIGLLGHDRTAITARAVAAAAGTSTAAVYELFGDKGGLLRAVFHDGFRRLHDTLAAVPTGADPRADLVALLAASRRFALDHPTLFEVMFARPFAEFEPGPDDAEAAAGIVGLVLRAVDRARAAGVLAGERRDLAHVLVAVNRGLVAAELAGIAGSSRAGVERRWRLGIDAVLDGLAAKEP